MPHLSSTLSNFIAPDADIQRRPGRRRRRPLSVSPRFSNERLRQTLLPGQYCASAFSQPPGRARGSRHAADGRRQVALWATPTEHRAAPRALMMTTRLRAPPSALHRIDGRSRYAWPAARGRRRPRVARLARRQAVVLADTRPQISCCLCARSSARASMRTPQTLRRLVACFLVRLPAKLMPPYFHACRRRQAGRHFGVISRRPAPPRSAASMSFLIL